MVPSPAGIQVDVYYSQEDTTIPLFPSGTQRWHMMPELPYVAANSSGAPAAGTASLDPAELAPAARARRPTKKPISSRKILSSSLKDTSRKKNTRTSKELPQARRALTLLLAQGAVSGQAPLDHAQAAARRRMAVKYPQLRQAQVGSDALLSDIASKGTLAFNFLTNLPGDTLPLVTQSVAVLSDALGSPGHPAASTEYCVLYLAGDDRYVILVSAFADRVLQCQDRSERVH